MGNWQSLKDNPPNPKEHYCVLLFPCISDVGIIYTTSNVDYAIGPYAIEAGYTHWMPVEKHPDHSKIEEMILEIYTDG
jgi:hypothetical protein